MPIHVGIRCTSCERVYFPGTTEQIDFAPPSTTNHEYRLTCSYPCGAIRLFRTYDMQPYSVSKNAYDRGYAHQGEYEELRRAG